MRTAPWILLALGAGCDRAEGPEGERGADGRPAPALGARADAAPAVPEEPPLAVVGTPPPIELSRAPGVVAGVEPAAGDGGSDAEPSGGPREVLEEAWPDGKPRLRRAIQRDADGLFNHGPFRKWHPNGVVAEEGNYVLGEKDGLYVVRWDTGFDKSRIEYRRGVQHGREQRWSEDGVLLYDATFASGELDGLERSWWSGEQLRSEVTWRAGVPVGESTTWSADGVVLEQGRYEDGMRTGTWTQRYPEGGLRSLEGYRAGKLHGRAIEYDPSGAVLAEREYADGVAHGIHLEFYAGGGKKSSIVYVAGKPDGPCETWYEAGAKESAGEMRAGLREGTWTFWRPDTTIDEARSGVYVAGELAPGSR
jgi:antitoxin component YwqK of YwqJK toxin-antitoxin module